MRRWKKTCPVLEQVYLGHEICLDFLFQKIPITTAEKRTVKPKNAFEENAFRVPLKVIKFYIWL
jgi:hypothetical protein